MVFRTFSAPFLNSLQPGATRSAALHACPWLSYCAPLALSGFHIPRLALSVSYGAPLALSGFIWRAFGAVRFYIARLWRCHVSYSAPGAQFPLFCKANGNRIEHNSDVV